MDHSSCGLKIRELVRCICCCLYQQEPTVSRYTSSAYVATEKPLPVPMPKESTPLRGSWVPYDYGKDPAYWGVF